MPIWVRQYAWQLRLSITYPRQCIGHAREEGYSYSRPQRTAYRFIPGLTYKCSPGPPEPRSHMSWVPRSSTLVCISAARHIAGTPNCRSQAQTQDVVVVDQLTCSGRAFLPAGAIAVICPKLLCSPFVRDAMRCSQLPYGIPSGSCAQTADGERCRSSFNFHRRRDVA